MRSDAFILKQKKISHGLDGSSDFHPSTRVGKYEARKKAWTDEAKKQPSDCENAAKFVAEHVCNEQPIDETVCKLGLGNNQYCDKSILHYYCEYTMRTVRVMMEFRTSGKRRLFRD